jgi:hypothetical protein
VDERLPDLPDAEVDDADERDGSDPSLDAPEEPAAEASGSNVLEERDERGDEDCRGELGDEFAVCGVLDESGRPHDGAERTCQPLKSELEDQERHRKRHDEEEPRDEARLDAPNEAHGLRPNGNKKRTPEA